ncbi:polysaccharide deacetylase family protein [Pseudoalteromonas maricaloris]|uniref:polysaccharide deacetylase family protein n=1 Tax=Pseudoalteromonas maricaloris TaxID=184924 RepID=UPI003C1F20FB
MKRFTFLLMCLFINTVYANSLTYPNGAKKAVIFSYDDGVIQDRRLVDLFNQYAVVGTFNISSGLLGQQAPWLESYIGNIGEYITAEEVYTLYQGHEVAGHSFSHPGLAGLEHTELVKQINNDQNILSSLIGQRITSFAYPLGSFDEAAKVELKLAGFKNARTVKDSRNFDIPKDFYQWSPTVHHSHAMPLVREYLEAQPDKLTVMLIWGHSWEFDEQKHNNNWNYMELLLKSISNKKDIWYVSAGDFTNFIQGNSE